MNENDMMILERLMTAAADMIRGMEPGLAAALVADASEPAYLADSLDMDEAEDAIPSLHGDADGLRDLRRRSTAGSGYAPAIEMDGRVFTLTDVARMIDDAADEATLLFE